MNGENENNDSMGEEALEYFKNLTSTPHDEVMSLDDIETVIRYHEDELAAEDKRVSGTDEYPNYGDDFADMVFIARRLLDHVMVQKQEIEKICLDNSVLDGRIKDLKNGFEGCCPACEPVGEMNKKLREERGLLPDPHKAKPPRYDNLQDLG